MCFLQEDIKDTEINTTEPWVGKIECNRINSIPSNLRGQGRQAVVGV